MVLLPKQDLKYGDIITQIDDTKIDKMSELRSYIYGKSPNDVSTVRITRNNKEYTLQVTLGRRN